MIELNNIITATKTTVILWVYSFLVGLVLGIILVILQSVRWKWIALSGKLIAALLRGLPEVLIVLFVYFGSTQLALFLSERVALMNFKFFYISIPIDYFEISPFFCGVIALGLLYAAYSSQTLHGALKAIPQGQWKSGQALGMNTNTIFFRIILPQIWRYALPGLSNQWLVLLKDTALVSLISVNDLMLQTKSVINLTLQPFTWYLLAAGIYLAITLLSQSFLYVFKQLAFFRKFGDKSIFW